MDRRKFIGITSSGIVGLTLLPQCKSSENSSMWRFFTNDEAKVIEAFCEQIIPADQDAGAKEANIVNFIDKQLNSYYKNFQDSYRKGISGIQETSKLEYNQNFEQLSADQQIQIMLSLESDKAKGKIWEENSSSTFFNLVRDHTMQGFYGSPKHGGNRNYASYKMIGIDAPHIIGQNRYHTSKSL